MTTNRALAGAHRTGTRAGGAGGPEEGSSLRTRLRRSEAVGLGGDDGARSARSRPGALGEPEGPAGGGPSQALQSAGAPPRGARPGDEQPGDVRAGGGRPLGPGGAAQAQGGPLGLDGAPQPFHPAGGAPSAHCPASELAIAGLVPLSTVDWPGRLSATVFTQGCPWNCHYCHNQDLIPIRVPSKVSWREVRDLLSRRRGLLDAVVFTGGEALRQHACAAAAAEARALGFEVGLHTAGAYPRRLTDLVAAGLVDWVGLDVKALPEHYPQVVGRPRTGRKAWDCLEMLVEAAGRGGPDFEVRTTVAPGDVTAEDAYEVARRVHAAGARTYALQQARSEGARADFIAVAPGWDAACERLAARIEALGWDAFTYRPAS
ncbi:anaerobic ribonucleoside-triphosphate reductase activating protein [Actinomyces bowdenii]|uniref:Anaerobic ribonucleoside-triphosphate reductase activating protein n=1 Tax=Actinomyces bowdenii TaxID=131109 RepID=A0A3P1V403_9ACTO|nr:anaerobic ribonucleoside-triphosphate reductase activating protein [Actinomyces bowdenii]